MLPPHSARVRLLTADNFMLYTPLLPGAAAGTLEPRHVVVPLREELDRSIHLRLGRIAGASPERKVVHVRSLDGSEAELAYDHLIVAIGSVNGLGALGDPAYSAAKAGMISLTRSLAVEYGRHGIRCNIVLPGTVRTPLWERKAGADATTLERLRKWYPLGRIVDPDDVSKAVAFLASDAAAAITGVALPVDCGLTAGNIVMTRELTLEDI